LNAAIESTLVICRHETSAVAEVTTDLGELPPVMGHVGELNQVFLNIILNAAEAIGDAPGSSEHRGTISIKTWADEAWVRIAIGDTGPGIAPDVLDKIFEPFFTTKPVGKGTGQGLAAARSIVVGHHGGKLDVSSRAGATTFTIALPV
ncbi:MAG TPA: ATP-binding protein, partial [Kofleriaceae bacterium]